MILFSSLFTSSCNWYLPSLYFYYTPFCHFSALSLAIMDSISSLRNPIRRKPSLNPDSIHIILPSLILFIKLLGRMSHTFCWLLQLVFILSPVQSGFSPKYSEAPFVTKLTNALLNAKDIQKALPRPPGYRPSLKHLDSLQDSSSLFVCDKLPCGVGYLSSYQRYKSVTEEETESILVPIEFVFSYQISVIAFTSCCWEY